MNKELASILLANLRHHLAAINGISDDAWDEIIQATYKVLEGVK